MAERGAKAELAVKAEAEEAAAANARREVKSFIVVVWGRVIHVAKIIMQECNESRAVAFLVAGSSIVAVTKNTYVF